MVGSALAPDVLGPPVHRSLIERGGLGRIKHGYPDASIATLEVVALKLLEDYAQKKIAQEPQVYSKTGTTVFIEHEKSPETVTPLVIRLSFRHGFN